MPYVNIPDSGLGGATAKIVGKIQGEVASLVLKKANDIVNKLNVDGCPSSNELNRLRKQKDLLFNQLSSIDGKLSKFKALPKKLKTPTSGLKAALRIILSLPIPQSVPPGFGLPINITTKYADLMHLIKELIKQIDELIQSIEVVIETPSLNLKSLNNLLSRAESAIKACELEKALLTQISEGRVTTNDLDTLGLYKDGNLITSTLGPKLFANTTGGKNRGIWTPGTEYYENDIVIFKKVKYICLKDHLSDNYNQPPSSFWSELDKATEDSTNSLVDTLQKLDNSNLSRDTKDQLKGLLDSFKGADQADSSKDVNFFYTAPNGQVLSIEILTDPNSPKIAPRRYAQAKNPNGGIVMTGPKSFSSDTKVLIDEIKFRIDNQLS